MHWETCTLRKYLNNVLLNDFSQEERNIIDETQNINNGTPYNLLDQYNNGGHDTQDKVFLLSIEQVNVYFHGDNDRIAVINVPDSLTNQNERLFKDEKNISITCRCIYGVRNGYGDICRG